MFVQNWSVLVLEYAQREVHHGRHSQRHKKLKDGDTNRKAVGERAAEIEGRCAGERVKIIGSCGLCLGMYMRPDTVCRHDWIWSAE